MSAAIAPGGCHSMYYGEYLRSSVVWPPTLDPRASASTIQYSGTPER
ncbi:MAG: hypothetical protein U0163_19300 [Gemmatimonadaceae bacterium]